MNVALNKGENERHTKEVETEREGEMRVHPGGNLHWHAVLRDCPSSIVVRITSLGRAD